VVGGDRPPLRFSTIFCHRSKITSELSVVSSLVSIGAVGIHGHPGRLRRNRCSGAVRIAGGLISSRTDHGAQVLPPRGAIVPPSLLAKSARVSNLLACCALGPPACAAPCSCHHEACSAHSAWPHPGKACPSQGFKARPHALSRFALARKRFIASYSLAARRLCCPRRGFSTSASLRAARCGMDGSR
jgi:hypothetical protein